jgi:hypothetical protein
MIYFHLQVARSQQQLLQNMMQQQAAAHLQQQQQHQTNKGVIHPLQQQVWIIFSIGHL